MSRPRLVDLGIALSLLSRVPVPQDHAAAGARAAQAAWAYPLVGAALGGAAGGLGWALAALGVPAGPAAAVMLAALVMVTGALHEDGLADSADGLWGGWDAARRLEIMRDSRIGAYGVLALGLGLLLRWSCLAALLAETGPVATLAALVAVGAMSRAAMVGVMRALPLARNDGLSHRVGTVPGWAAGLAAAVGLGTGLAVLGPVAAVVLGFAGGIAAILVGRLARSRIGGQTGDILGATQQVAEILGLLALATLVAQST
ncbi:adenosylcobinamide-GDP ribazoletransferase [Dinoroseobacter sp. PD6]|uniref:adenosylcobinamide-GDP ribazoletransferase n=1 Tax=Dinoroseobacter sp. PD6 TaxID=3028384 RepID=UPI00237C2C4D|nr:adenosylcobinamide-GDP ribazoletransferase [Dinoroseobacter sp. PD6]MDD9718206.1 adenosylcobinamide-GDP ribazoletransferase [Dinoroseobacter sp. PD6]